MKWSINSLKHYDDLGNALGKALCDALRDSLKAEPQLVANLVWHLPKEINKLSFSNGFSVKSGGVFVHAQPFVKCNNFPETATKSVEIGDLLLLRTGIQNGIVVDRRALLLQAKKFDRLPAKPDNHNQHHLYANWPTFEYVRSTKALDGKKRHVTGFDLYNAAKYLLIGRDPYYCCDFPCCGWCHPHFHRHGVFTAQPSQPEFSHYRCFVHEMIEFILGDAGKTYVSPPPKRTRNWDRVIQDLTEVTAKRASVYIERASSLISCTRGQPLTFLTGDFLEISMMASKGISPGKRNGGRDGPPDVPDGWPQDNDGEGGISIIEFVVASGEKRAETL